LTALKHLSTKESSQNMGIYHYENTLLFSEPALETLLRTMDSINSEATSSRKIFIRFGREFSVVTFRLGGFVDGDKSFS
jgi:hypothetical protein